jgi:hypothetical protein
MNLDLFYKNEIGEEFKFSLYSHEQGWIAYKKRPLHYCCEADEIKTRAKTPKGVYKAYLKKIKEDSEE